MAQVYTVHGATLPSGSGGSSPSSPTHSTPTDDNSLQTTNNSAQTSSFNINNLTPIGSPPSQLAATKNASMSYTGTQDLLNRLPAMDQHSRPYATPTGYSYQHAAQAQAQPKVQSPTHQGWQQSGPMYQAAPRSMESPSWRGSLSSGDQFNSNSVNPTNYTLASPMSSPSASSAIAHANLSNNLMSSYSYCLQRPDGQYTRLIPADMLPALNEIPARQASARGMMLLPDLHSQPPQGVANMNQPITIKAPNTPASENLQNRIDRIVATSNGNPKKTKIYCDKWIHDGTCAFTQQGCKYKHEMPFDKATQHALGLFHGFPKWWRDLQEELQERENDKTGNRAKPFLQQDWRKGSGSSATSPRGSQAQAPIGAERDQQVSSRPPHPSPPTSDAQSRCIWGPIEPPQRTGLESGGLITPSTFKKWTNAEQASPNLPRARPTSLPPT